MGERRGRLDLLQARLESIGPAPARLGVEDEVPVREAARGYTQVRESRTAPSTVYSRRWGVCATRGRLCGGQDDAQAR
jgi:hypothetical protein